MQTFLAAWMILSFLGCLVLLPGRPRWGLWTALLGVYFCCCNLFKAGLIQAHLDSPVQLPLWHWFWQALTLWGVVAACQWMSPSGWTRWLWVAHATLGLLFFGDQLYERYFDDVPGFYVVTQLAQAGATAASTMEILKLEDVAFILDVLVGLPLLWVQPPQAPPRSQLVWAVGAPFLFSLYAPALFDAQDRHVLRLRFRNVAAVQRLGLVHYHFYDVMQWLFARYENVLDPSFDQSALKKYTLRSRRSIAAPTAWKGRYRGQNLLIFSLESLECVVLHLKVNGQEVTPFLNSLARRSWAGGLCDQTGQGRSSDGLFVVLNSLLPPGQRPLAYAYPSNDFRGLPAILNDHGYHTCLAVPYYGSFWNVRHMARKYGFAQSLFREQIPPNPQESIGWGINDKGLVARLQGYWKRFPRPFFAYTVCMMGHHPYRELQPSQERLKLGPEFQGTMLGRYLQLCRERDEEWRCIVQQLKEKGLWDSSVVVLLGDHDARLPDHEMPLLGLHKEYNAVVKAEQDRVFFLLHTPDEALRGSVPDYGSQCDVAPTLMHLLGASETPSAMLGLNLLAASRRDALVSKGGYAIDSKVVVVDDGREWVTYDRGSHRVLKEADSVAAHEMTRVYDLTRDILRLNLVPTMLRIQ
jgi:phosphoglycerol transferase MdoB-like AlkP superfamily enzyme